MDSGLSGPTQAAPTYCATCGRPLTAGLAACPNCGTPVAAGTPAAAPAPYTNDMTVPSGPTWQAAPASAEYQAPTWQTPVAAQAAPAKKRGRRTLVMGGIASVLVVALLATGALYVFGAFAGHSELDAAKYLPANTFAFSGVDVYSLAENSHNISLNTLEKGGGGSLTSGSGLDWANDVLPWLGRDIAAGAFPEAAKPNSPSSSPVAAVALIQSHDDTKAQAAMKKAASHGVSEGSVTSTYSGFTLYSQPGFSDSFDGAASAPAGTTFTAGKGWAVIASDPAAAKVVIDRLNGSGDTLASQQGFQNATNNLPGNRFGTVYVDLRAVASLRGVDSSLGSTPQLTQFLNTYPVGEGFTSWTNAGLHAQLTFDAAKNAGTQYPAGDAAALAAGAPANAYAYVSIGNFGGDLKAGASQLGGDSTSSITQALGVPLTDPALQQPAALTVFPTATGSIGGALLLKAPDAGAASAFLQSLASANNCTVAPAVGTDASAQALSCPSIDLSPLGLGGGGDFTGDTGGFPAPSLLVEQTNGVMVFAPDSDSLQAVTSTLSGGHGLASDATFKSLVGQAPSGAQTLTFVSISAFTNAIGAIVSAGGSGSGSGSGASATPTPSASPIQPTALLISSVSDSSKTEVSFDLALK
jgi:hypothetical protein